MSRKTRERRKEDEVNKRDDGNLKKPGDESKKLLILSSEQRRQGEDACLPVRDVPRLAGEAFGRNPGPRPI